MAPLLLDRKEVDDLRWNSAVAASSEAVIYGFSWYLDLVCDDWAAVVWPSRTDYQIIMPLPLKKKWGIRVVYQPFFCQYLGIFSYEIITPDLAEKFLAVADSLTGFISEYRFSPQNQTLVEKVLPRFPNWQHEVTYTHWLPLGRDYPSVAAGYSHDRRANLRKALAWEWQVKKSTDVMPLINLFRQNHERKIEGGVSHSTYERLSKLLQYLLDHGFGELWYAVKAGEPAAGIFVEKVKRRSVYLFNAANLEGRRGNARTFLLDHYFRIFTEDNINFDFESPDVPSIADFYKSFGAEPKALVAVRKNNLPFPWKQFRLLRGVIFSLQKRFASSLKPV